MAQNINSDACIMLLPGGDSMDIKFTGSTRGIPKKNAYSYRISLKNGHYIDGMEFREETEVDAVKVGKEIAKKFNYVPRTTEPRPRELSREHFFYKARKAVKEEFYSFGATTLDMDRIYVGWSCKALQNWKCVITTDLEDGRYYEVTYDGDKKCMYVDAYSKVENITIYDQPTY